MDLGEFGGRARGSLGEENIEVNGGLGHKDLTERNQRHAEYESGDRGGGGNMCDLAEAAGGFVDTIGVSVGSDLEEKDE